MTHNCIFPWSRHKDLLQLRELSTAYRISKLGWPETFLFSTILKRKFCISLLILLRILPFLTSLQEKQLSILFPMLMTSVLFWTLTCPGGFSHWHGIRICACLLGHFFTKFGIAIGGFHQRRRSPNYINWVYFGQIIVKSTQFDPNWVLFFRKWYTDGWEIWQKIGIEIVRFWRSGRHIHVRFWWKNPPPPGLTWQWDHILTTTLVLPHLLGRRSVVSRNIFIDSLVKNLFMLSYHHALTIVIVCSSSSPIRIFANFNASKTHLPALLLSQKYGIISPQSCLTSTSCLSFTA